MFASRSTGAKPKVGERALLPGGLVQITQVCERLVHFCRLDADIVSGIEPLIGSTSGVLDRIRWRRLMDPNHELMLDSLQG
jgi:hypothetical protein